MITLARQLGVLAAATERAISKLLTILSVRSASPMSYFAAVDVSSEAHPTANAVGTEVLTSSDPQGAPPAFRA